MSMSCWRGLVDTVGFANVRTEGGTAPVDGGKDGSLQSVRSIGMTFAAGQDHPLPPIERFRGHI